MSPNQLDAKSQAWSALFSEPMSELVKRYTASVFFDRRLWQADIQGSLAHAEMLAAQANGDHTRALKIHLELMPLFKTLFLTANPIMVKKALELVGFPVGSARLPLIPATDEQTAELARVMRHLGLID
jgi:hypothetical protein